VKIYFLSWSKSINNTTTSTMNILLDKLKNDTLTGMFDVSGRAWIPTLIASFLQMAVGFIASFFLLTTALGITMDDLNAIQSMSQDPFSNQRALEEMGMNLAQNIGVASIPLMVLFFIVAMLLMAWINYVAILSVKFVISNGKANLAEILSASFDGNVFSLFLLYLVIYVFMIVGVIVVSIIASLFASMSAALGMLVGFAGAIATSAILWQFTMAIPIIALENESETSAISKGMNAFSFKKGLKYTFLTFLGVVGLFVVLFILGLVSGIFSSIPYVGMIIGQVINSVLSAFIITMMAALYVSMYYKYYASEDDDNNVLEDHLIYNS